MTKFLFYAGVVILAALVTLSVYFVIISPIGVKIITGICCFLGVAIAGYVIDQVRQ